MRKRRPTSTFALIVSLIGCAAAGALARIGDDRLPRAAEPLPVLPDVNRDPAARLQLLPRIGPVRADAIVRERKRGGDYRELDALERVRGIGPATVEALSDVLEVREGG